MESRLLSLFALFLLSGILYSCTKEDDDKISNNGERHLEFKINVSDFRESIGGSQTEQEAAVKSLFLFLFDANGKEVLQESRQHTFDGDAFSITLPEDVVTDGVRAYLVANEEIQAKPITETELLRYKTTRQPKDFINKGFPMSTARIDIPTANAVSQLPVTATLQRIPSALYVQVGKVEGLEDLYNNSYQIEVEDLQTTEGALFSDAISENAAQEKTDYSSKLTAVNTPENIAYFYQSKDIKIHITPRRPDLGKVKDIVIDNTNTINRRNKKYLLTIKPIKTATRSIDFSLQVTEWDTEVIVAEIPLAPDKPQEDGVLFAKNVTMSSGWYDQNKAYGKEGFSYDSNLCWACASTNMIQWWQNLYIAGGGVLPVTTPNGYIPGRETASYRQLAVFEEFAKKYPNDPGYVLTAVSWYFKTFLPDVFPNHDFAEDDNTVFAEFYPSTIKDFSNTLIAGFEAGGVFGMSSYTPRHVRTLWGCRYDTETKIVKEIFITDSDDKFVGIWKDMPVRVSPEGEPMANTAIINRLSLLYPPSNVHK